jgi:hypothetical protein
MGAAAKHPFLQRVLDHLHIYAHTWLLPYLTVMLSTGPLFLSVMWKEYIWSHPRLGEEVSVLMPNWYGVPGSPGIQSLILGLRKMKLDFSPPLEVPPGIALMSHSYFGYVSIS